MLRLFVLLLACLVLGRFAAAGDALVLSATEERQPARPHAAYYDGPAPGLQLATAAARPELFRPAAARALHLGGDADHWLRLPLVNGEPAPLERVLALGVPDAELLAAYRLDGGLPRPLLHLPAEADYTARPLPARLLGLPISLAPNASTVLLLRYRVHGDTPLSQEILSPGAFQRDLARGDLLNGVVLGILLVLALLALLQYLATEQRAYLAYTGMAVSMLAFLLQIEGYNFAYLWPGQGAWNQAAPMYLALLMQLSHATFALTLFDMRRRHPRLYRFYLGYLLLLAAGMAVYLASGREWPALVAALAYTPLVLAAGFYLLRQDQPVAGFFLAGSLAYAVFTNLLFGLSVFGIGWNVSPFVYPKLGYLCEAGCFALALARQTHSLRRRVEDGLRRQLAEAEQLARAEADKHRALLTAREREMRLASTGHDLSQPLASIRLALAGLAARADNQAATRHIDQALDYTESLLRGLIGEARQSYAAQDRELELLDLLADVRQRHLAQARAKGLEIRLHPCAYRVAGSATVLARILDNLVGNAVRYTSRGGLLLGVRRRPDGLEIQVLDSGPGLDTRRLDQLLAPFRQSGDLAAEKLGHGLGLHIVRTLCEQSGYRLRVSATPGRGSCFGVVLPKS